MSKGSAIIAILIAFVGGFAIGHLSSGIGGDDSAAVEIDGDAAGADIQRFKIPVTDDQPSKGPEDALVTIVEFSEFECPFCKRVLPTTSRIMNEYKGKVRFVWRNNPLPFHASAMGAANASVEAFKQGGSEKFWKMHDLMFENQQSLKPADLERYARSAGLDVGKVKAAIASKKYASAIQADQQIAQKMGARGTPAFFINGRQLMGAQPFERFKEVIDDEIRRAESLVKEGLPAGKVYAALTKNGLTSAPAPEADKAKQPARRRPDPDAVYKVTLQGNEPQKGPDDALVTIVEFSDFECPFCGRVEPTVAQIVKKYGRDVRVVWMNNPLPFHQNAGPAAMAALEAHKQGGDAKFWKMHEKLFANQRGLTRENLESYAKEIGLNMAQFRSALDGKTHQKAIDAQQQIARSLGATGTPSFFINGRNLRGAQPLPAFEQVIDQELAKAKALVAKGTPRSGVYAATIKSGATSPKFLDDGPAAAPAAAAPDADKVYEIAAPRNAPFKGGRNAKVVVQLFSDFQCPFCGRVLPTIKQVEQEYGNKVKIVWRDYPLPFHQEAGPAAQAAREVFKQGGNDKFWKFHDLLFTNQKALGRADLEKYAQQVGGINMAQFRSALDSQTHKAGVDADLNAVRESGARIGTPSFFINGRLLQGAQPFPAFKAAIDRALKEG